MVILDPFIMHHFNANEFQYAFVLHICDLDNHAWRYIPLNRSKVTNMLIIMWPLTLITQDTWNMIIEITNMEWKFQQLAIK